MVRCRPVFAGLLASFFAAAPAAAQIAGENVNMVSGTQWPGGDPFLQRQNEPTIGVSSVNAQHLMAGANDYRSVDIADPDFGKPVHGDAWLGVFKSLDGGQTWKSFLLEGYPQDPHCQAKPADPAAPDHSRRRHHGHCKHRDDNTDPSPALCGMPAAADPVMRSGTDGLFYYMGINFLRDKSRSRLFVARFIDHNNREGADPIQFIDTRVIARSDDPAANLGKAVFIDKPWLAVDVPRGNQTCTVPDAAGGTKTIAAGTVYAAWAQFTANDATSDIMFSWSTDCAATWVTPRKLNTSNSTLNQGVTIAIEPVTGRVFVAWRRVALGKQTDAIMVTRSEGRKRHFAAPRAIAKFTPFDLGQGGGQARTQTMPSMAISADGTSSYVHIAWAARGAPGVAGGPGLSRIFMTGAKVLPRPTGDDDDDDPEDSDDETRVSWTPAKVISTAPPPADDDAGHFLTQGHQYMPSLTFGQGRLMLAYYDTRYDHTRRYFRPNAATAVDQRSPPTLEWLPDATGRFYQEELGPIGELASQSTTDRNKVFGTKPVQDAAGNLIYLDLDDGSLTQTRHTVDVRVGMAMGPNGGLPGLDPTFTSVLVSRFPFGMRGDERLPVDAQGAPLLDAAGRPVPLTVPAFGATAPLSDGITLVGPPPAGQALGELKLLQQLQLNVPGFPMFKNGTTAFFGDYLDVQGPSFAPGAHGGWVFNYQFTPAPVFHAAWTSNQDVKVPPDGPSGPQWTRYTPLTLPWHPAGGPALYDGGSAPNVSNPNVSNATVAECTPETSLFAGTRDQNIYTSRITDGLQVSTPQNSKYLIRDAPVGFVVAAVNTTSKPMRVAFEAPTFDPSLIFAADATPAWSYAGPPTMLPSVEADIAPHTSVHRTLFVTQQGGDSGRTIHLTVRELDCGTGCRSGAITFNPPVALNSLIGPIGVSDPNAGEVYVASISSPNVSNPNVSNPNVSNPNVSNPNVSNPNVSNPNVSNPNVSNPNVSNPNVSNPNVSNPNVSNPNVSNPNVSNAPVSDLIYTVTNEGNTTASYHVKVVAKDPAKIPSPLQLILSKTYLTPAAVGCDLKEVAHDQVVASVPDINRRPAANGAPQTDLVKPGDPVRPGASGPNVSNATIALAPGETATITLRAFVPVTELLKVAGDLAPAPVPASVPETNTSTYQDWGSSSTGTKFVKIPTVTTLTQAGANTLVHVAVAPGSTGSGAITGLITWVRSRAGVDTILGAATIESFGGDTPVLATSPQPGDVITASYGGSAVYAASASNAATTTLTSFMIGGTFGDGVVSVYVRDGVSPFAAFDGATVTVNGVSVPRTGPGLHSGAFALPAAGQPVTVVVSAGGLTATGTSVVPQLPTMTAPLAGTTFPLGSTLRMTWTSPVPDPDRNLVSFGCGPTFGPCPNGSAFSVPGANHEVTSPAGFFPSGPVGMVLYARNLMSFSGAAHPASQVEVDVRTPAAGWSTFTAAATATRTLGTLLDDRANAVARDSAGNLYVAGETDGVMAGAASFGGTDVFLMKYDAGHNLLWARQLGGPGQDTAQRVALDGSGNVYVAGFTGGQFAGSAGGAGVFLARFDPSGSLVWSQDQARTVTSATLGLGIDGVRQVVYLATSDSDFAFHDAYDLAGNFLRNVTLPGVVAQTNRLALDSAGNVYVVGITAGVVPGTDLGGGAGGGVVVPGGGGDAYLVKYDTLGRILWARQLTGAGTDEYTTVATGADGSVTVAGYVTNGIGVRHGLVARFGQDGTPLWTRQPDLASEDIPEEVVVDEQLVGATLVCNAYVIGNAALYDPYLVKYDPAGTRMAWATTIRDTPAGTSRAKGVFASASGDLWVVGYFMNSIDGIPTQGGAASPTPHDGFLLLYDASLGLK